MPRIKLTLASAMGTCFGVQDAIDMALQEEFRDKLTIVGQLVHNPQTCDQLRENGIKIVDRDQIDQITTKSVMITAHGSSDHVIASLREKGFIVYDASCPLVLRLHKLARYLQRKGYFPVVIGQRDHVEVQGVIGNLEDSAVIGSADDFHLLKGHKRIGVVSQTTNRLAMVQEVVNGIRALPEVEEVRFVDTICQPVKDRQDAIVDLLGAQIDLGIVIGGYNSSNTRKLLDLLTDNGVRSYQIERPDEIQEQWLDGATHIGVTAGTSTPQDVIEGVSDRLRGLISAISTPFVG